MDIIKSQKKDHCGIPPLKFNGHVYNDSLGKAKVLDDYFTSVFTPVLSAPPSMDGPLLSDITPIKIDPNGVVELLKKSENPQSYWPRQNSSLPTQRSKHGNCLYTHALLYFMQASLQQSSVPSDWKMVSTTSQTTMDQYH